MSELPLRLMTAFLAIVLFGVRLTGEDDVAAKLKERMDSAVKDDGFSGAVIVEGPQTAVVCGIWFSEPGT